MRADKVLGDADGQFLILPARKLQFQHLRVGDSVI